MDNETEINVELTGEGQAVLLVHGFLENAGMWQSLMPAFHGRQVIIPELPGHGHSQWVDEPVSMEYFADLLADILDAVEVERADIIGHSMGGYAACALLERHPDRVNSLCLYHSSARADSAEKRVLRDRAIEAVKENRRLYAGSMIRGLFSAQKRRMLESDIARLVDEAAAMSPETITGCLAAMRDRNDRSDIVKNAEIRTAYLLGTDDERLPEADMKKEVIATEAAHHLFLNGVGHMSQLEAPQAAIAFFEEWLSLNVRS